MSTDTCPTSLDWLDALESGPLSEELQGHLATCARCRQIVAGLCDAPAIGDLSVEPTLARASKALHEDPSPSEPRSGELWLTADSYEEDGEVRYTTGRDVVVVTGDASEGFGHRWWPAAVADTEVEAAAGDEVWLNASETSLKTPLRVRLAFAEPLNRGQLGARVGALNDNGIDTVQAALDGTVDPRRVPSPITGPADERVVNDEAAYRRSWQRRGVYESHRAAAEHAAVSFWEQWQDGFARAREAARELVLYPFAELGPRAAAPAAAAFRRASEVVERLLDMPDLQMTSSGGNFAALVEEGWPITRRTMPALQPALEPTEAGARIVVKGVPAELEGTRPVVALPVVDPAAVSAAWLGDTPGLLVPSEPVRDGTLVLTLDRVADKAWASLLDNMAILPPQGR